MIKESLMLLFIASCCWFQVVVSQTTTTTTTTTTTSTTTTTAAFYVEDIHKMKAHGCLMVIAWILFASTGIVIARYYRFLLPSIKICEIDFWFILHRPIMLMVTALSVTGFLVILAFREWTWVPLDEPHELAHSIFGIIAIGVAVIQPFIGALRCDQKYKYRFIFDWIHRCFGLFGFLCSIVALYLGVLLDDVNLGDNGWGIITGWTVWAICYPAFLEMIELYMNENEHRGIAYQVNEEQATKRTKWIHTGRILKSILLIIHLIVAFAFTVALVVLIGIAPRHEDED